MSNVPDMGGHRFLRKTGVRVSSIYYFKQIKENKLQTKGPWEFNIFKEYPDQRGGFFIYSPGVKSCIAKLFTSGEHRDYVPEKNEAYDNARLIAAAPDLLEACKTSTVAIENLLNQHPELVGSELVSLHSKLCETIAKATGITRIRSIRQ